MPKKDGILNLPGFSIQKVIPGNPMVLEVNYRRKAQCPYCGYRQLRKKDSFNAYRTS